MAPAVTPNPLPLGSAMIDESEEESPPLFLGDANPEDEGFDAEALENAVAYAFDERFNTKPYWSEGREDRC